LNHAYSMTSIQAPSTTPMNQQYHYVGTDVSSSYASPQSRFVVDNTTGAMVSGSFPREGEYPKINGVPQRPQYDMLVHISGSMKLQPEKYSTLQM